jgi:hypothetical protein
MNGPDRSTHPKLRRVTIITGQALALSQLAGAPTRFVRQNHFPIGWEAVTAEFLELFPQRYGYIYRPLNGGSWLSANEKWALSDNEILKAVACQHPRFFLGLRAARSTRYAIVDIDAGSKYHTLRNYQRLCRVLASAGITKVVPYRSSFSGGWHVYIFFDEWLPAKQLRQCLVELLLLSHFEVAKGQLEVFPHPGTNSLGTGLRLPLQPGWAWLDTNTLDVSHERSEVHAAQAVELFIDDLTADSNSISAFHHLQNRVVELRQKAAAARDAVVSVDRRQDRTIPGADDPEITAVFGHSPPGMHSEIWLRGRLYFNSGLTEQSTRADAIYCLNHYLFYGDPSEALPAFGYGCDKERDAAVTHILETKHNGHSKDISRRRKDAFEQVSRAATWVPAHMRGKELTAYSATVPASWAAHNRKLETEARKKITQAVETFVHSKLRFSQRDLWKASGCGMDTIRKHRDLWEQQQAQLSVLLESDPGVINAVEGGSCPESPAPTDHSEKMPPGRLAARQIAYELSMRARRDQNRALSAATASLEAAEKEWEDKSGELLEQLPGGLTIEQLKLTIALLTFYLQLASCEEDAVLLQLGIKRFRNEFQRRSGNLMLVPRSPP